jgi:tRNA (mo5U34)-methyltransferase
MKTSVESLSPLTYEDWLRMQIAKEPYWFHRIELGSDIVTPGWSDPKSEKLPHFGLPDDMHGMRVLDIGCSEGFFSFESERRGASEVLAIDSMPESVRRFNICRAALGSSATAFLTSVYDLNRRAFGTFDLVMFFGVLYHLRHPLLALEKVYDVCSGTVLLQTNGFEDPALEGSSYAKFYPRGIQSGPPEKPIFDVTVFWMPNSACVRDMMTHVGFVDVEKISMNAGFVFRGRAPSPTGGIPPDKNKAPWA